MLEEAERLNRILRFFAEKDIEKRGTPPREIWQENLYMEDLFRNAANLIESLSAELEQVKRERDAAVEDMVRLCAICVHCRGCDEWDDEVCMTCNNKSKWQWRGVNGKGATE